MFTVVGSFSSGGHQTAGCRAGVSPSQTPCCWASHLCSRGLMLCRPAGRGVASLPNISLSGVSK